MTAFPSGIVAKSLMNEKVRLMTMLVDELKECKKKIREFQDHGGELSSSFDHLDQMAVSITECTHILVFNQEDETSDRRVTRVFLCKREINNGNLQVLHCLASLSSDPFLSDKSRCMCRTIYELSKLLRDCTGGLLFPYELVNWVAHRVCAMEQIHAFTLAEKSMWLLSEDEKRSTKVLKKKGEDFHFDNLYVYFSFNYKEFSKNWHNQNKNSLPTFLVVKDYHLRSFLAQCSNSSVVVVSNSSVVTMTHCE